MKKILYIACVAVVGIACLQACMEDSKVTYEGPALTYFNTTNGTFFIQDAPDQVYNIRLTTTAASDEDRTVNLSITSNATAEKGTQYDYTSSDIVIPAGSYVADLPVTGFYSGYVAGNVDTLFVKIAGGDIDTADFKQDFQLVMRKYCPVVLEDLYGYYTAMEAVDGSAPSASYNMAVLPNPNGGDTLILRNLWGVSGAPGEQDVKIVIDYSDPANFTTNMAFETQNLYMHPTYGQLWVIPTKKGTFSSCDRTMSVYYGARVGAGSFGNFVNEMVWVAPLE